MRLPVALLLAVALAVSSAVAWSAHVHAYTEHDHPEHHHGVAAHTHGRLHHRHVDDHRAADRRATPSAQPCDPARHAVSVTMGCTEAPRFSLDRAVMPTLEAVVALTDRWMATEAADVRAHGPPCERGLPSRAPPRSRLA